MNLNQTVLLSLAACVLAGCTAPIAAHRVSTREAYAQVEANALHTRKPGASTISILHRYNLDRLAAREPDEAIRQLHQKALATSERDILFALAELSYFTADRLRRSVKPWDPRDPRDYYLSSALYAWLFLFGETNDPKPGPFDRRFRDACDFYNASLGLALTRPGDTNRLVHLQPCSRRVPGGEVLLQFKSVNFAPPLEDFEKIVLADQLRVRGFSVRNREPGLGAPIVCVKPADPEFAFSACTPATLFLRGPASIRELSSPGVSFTLEIYSAVAETTLTVAGTEVPLEIDLTAHRAYSLTGSRVWRLGHLDFLAPARHLPNQLIMSQPYAPDRIPVVFVHGTFSSPVTWAEMANSLTADPLLRRRYQVWAFMYGSGNPLVQSISDLRSNLTATVQQLDPAGTNALLRQMVLIGHSQGGLLTKATAIDTGDRLWRTFSTNRLEDLDIPESDREELRASLFLQPLPFVKRVIFIATPHRGSYLAGNLARRLAQKIVSLPGSLVHRGTEMLKIAAGSQTGTFLEGRLPTSLDGMSPRNPGLLAMAEIPVSPEITAHSIIPVLDNRDLDNARDGVVSYQSAHLEDLASECIVLSKHSCLNHPATIEEVRRILREHLRKAPGSSGTLSDPLSPRPHPVHSKE